MHEQLESIATALTATGVVGLIARAYLVKSLQSLDACLDAIAAIKTELATISVHLKNLKESHQLVYQIERRVSVIEAQLAKHDIIPPKSQN